MNKLKKEIAQYALGPIESNSPEAVSCRYTFPAAFVGFSGHFPGHPVVPAFVQVMTAVALAEAWKSRPLQLSSVERAKFRIELRPDQEIHVRCRERETGEGPVFEADLTVTEGLAATFTIKFT